MHKFRTVVSNSLSKHKLSLEDKILTMGSCFAHAIGVRLLTNKFQALANPLGVIYNPHSIHKALRNTIFNEPPPDHTFLQHHDVHLNYDFHSEFSSLKKDNLISHLTETIGSVHHFSNSTCWLMITYGTAWVYERTDTGEIVANCHKMPGKLFSKSLLTQQKITESFEEFYKDLKAFNPAIRIILTVSPVRHLKDTLELNSVSKSMLRITCHALSEMYDDVEYFPAYEIMMDDLRDYRFYKPDMIHPSEEAENYIWEKDTRCHYH